MTQCTAKTKAKGNRCLLPAAEGYTVCRLHGGASLRGEQSPTFKHGRYSRFLNTSLQAKMIAVDDENPLDLLPELHIQRALFAEYVSKFQPGLTLAANDIEYLMGWSSEIARTVERIVKMRNDTALTAAEVALIAIRIPEVVAKYIDDPERAQRFVSDLFASIGVVSSADQPQLANGVSEGGSAGS